MSEQIQYNEMDHQNDNSYGAIGFAAGSIISVITGSHIWTIEINAWFPTVFALKFMATVILAAASGITAMTMKDVYKYIIHPYFVKKFKLKNKDNAN